MEGSASPQVIGHQWYWSYEYSDYANGEKTIGFDSYMVPEDDLEPGQLRLLEVDNRMVVPVNTCIRILVTAADVIHSWAVPSLGLKVDAIPGRLNVAAFQALREGIFYGVSRGSIATTGPRKGEILLTTILPFRNAAMLRALRDHARLHADRGRVGADAGLPHLGPGEALRGLDNRAVDPDPQVFFVLVH